MLKVEKSTFSEQFFFYFRHIFPLNDDIVHLPFHKKTYLCIVVITMIIGFILQVFM